MIREIHMNDGRKLISNYDIASSIYHKLPEIMLQVMAFSVIMRWQNLHEIGWLIGVVNESGES
jgi:hypothetical protein